MTGDLTSLALVTRPNQQIFLSPHYDDIALSCGGTARLAARAGDGSFAIIYSPRGESFTLDKNVIKAERQNQYWYDPRYGVSYMFKEQDSWGIQTFTPPTSGRSNDWILVLTDAAAGFSLPGAAR